MTLPRRWRLALLAFLGALALVLLSSWWLVRSTGGRDWALARVVALLPAGASLEWDSATGNLSGPMDIRGLRYRMADGTRFEAKAVHVEHGLWPLLSRRLTIRLLRIEDATLALPRDDEPFRWPRWPESLPRLELPITVDVARLQVRRLSVTRAGAPLLAVARIDGGFSAGPGRLQVRQLRLASDRGNLQLAGEYLPRNNFRTRVRARADMPAPGGGSATVLGAGIGGSLDGFTIALQGRAPAPISARLQLRNGRSATPDWQFTGASSQLQLSRFGLDDSVPLAIDLRADGRGGAATVAGTLARDTLQLVIAPSQLELRKGVLQLAPLALQLPQGPLQVTGTLALEGRDPRFELRAVTDGLRLTPESSETDALPVVARGALQLRGLLRAWTLAGDAVLARGAQQATVTVAGRGDAAQLILDALHARTPNGSLKGSGRAQWSPTLALALDTVLKDFDPGYFLPDFPGAVSGTLVADVGRSVAGAWSGQAALSDLRGQLRKRLLRGSGELEFAGDGGRGALNLQIGASRIDAGGSFGADWDARASFTPLQLADLWPDAGGRLEGTVEVSGPRAALGYRADLRGQGLQWAGYKAATLSALGTLPARGAPGHLRVAAQGVSLQGQSFDAASIELNGTIAAFDARAELAGPVGRFTAHASAAGRGRSWQGRIGQLQLVPARGAAWRLQAPAEYRWNNSALQLDRLCLVPADLGGQLCAQASGTRATVRGSGLPLVLAQPWLADNALGMRPYGEFALSADLARGSAGAWGGRVEVRSARGGLQVDETAPRELFGYTELQLDLLIAPPRVTADLRAGLSAGGSVSGHAVTGLSSTAALQGQVQFDVRKLDWTELLSPDIAGPSGHLGGTLQLSGTPGTPEISGEARLRQFSAELPALGLKLQAGDFVLRGDPGGQTRLTGQVTSGKGVLNLEGSLNFRDRSSPLRLRLHGRDITVADTPDLFATMSPELQLTYADSVLQLRGDVGVPSARIDLERLDNSVSASPDVVVMDPVEPAGRSPIAVDTDVTLQLGDAVQLRGFGLDGTLGGALRIRDRPGRVAQANGTLDVAGRYMAYGRALTIKRGRLGYLNAPIENPTLDILAEREYEQVTVGVRVRGTALAPQTTVVSNPSMATAEALSWLVIGRPLSSASGSETQRISASALAMSAGSNLLAQRLGSRLGLDDAGINESRTLGGSALTLGKQLSPRLFVSYGLSLIGTGQVLTLKYLLSHGLNVSVESGSVETAGSINWRKEK